MPRPDPTTPPPPHPAPPIHRRPPGVGGHAAAGPRPAVRPVLARRARAASRDRGPGRGRRWACWPGWCCRPLRRAWPCSSSLVAAGLTVAYAARHRRDPFTLACLALAALLHAAGRCCSTPTWIGVLCLLAGATALIAGVTRVRRFPEFVLAGVSWPLAGLRGLPWLGRSLRSLTGHGSAPRVAGHRRLVGARGAGLRAAVRLGRRDRGELGRRACCPTSASTPSCCGSSSPSRSPARRSPRRTSPSTRPHVELGVLAARRPVAHRFEWLVPVLLVDAVFAVFVAAQLSVLFGGHDYVQRTTGLTYADYVHQGFGQLTVATAAHPARRLGRLALGRRRASRTGSGCAARWACCAPLTLVVVGSALYRMHLYQEAYGFTQLRLLVDVFEGWLGLVVLAVAVAGLVRWGVWLPRFALVSGVVALLGVAAINPDAWIAERNLDRYADTGRVDWHLPRSALRRRRARVRGPLRDARSCCGLPRYWSAGRRLALVEPRPEPRRRHHRRRPGGDGDGPRRRATRDLPGRRAPTRCRRSTAVHRSLTGSPVVRRGS